MQKTRPWKIPSWKTLRRRGLYLPAITIVMIVFTLIVIQSISTIRHIDLHRRHWEVFLERKGREIISLVKAQTLLDNSLSTEGVKGLLDRIVENLDIAYMGLLDKNGRWIVASKSSQGQLLSPPEAGEWDRTEKVSFSRRIKDLPDGRTAFEFAESEPDADIQIAVVGLWTTALHKARDEDIRHGVMMGIILLFLGSAAIFFIFLVQNYYLVDRALTEMKSYTENVVESMANGLITVDTKGQIVSTNYAASRVLGFDMTQISGRSIESVIPLHRLDIHKLLEREMSAIEKEIDCPSEEGTVPLSVSVTPLRGAGGAIMGAVIILRDLREIRELQERVRRSERLASLGRLASGVAHEIRNPLSSVKGFAQYFRDKFEGGSEDKSYAEIMIKEVERLDRVITQLLDFARPQTLRRHPYSLSLILEHPLRLIQPGLEESGIKLITSQFPDNKINVDSDQIGQALLNIFLNAMDSMERGGELRVHILPKPERRGVEIWISDTGTGIRKEDITRIFDPFFSTKKKGTGLGLAITAKIIEAHGGEVFVESEEGKGTTFKIHLPFIYR
jgi:two-component system sensor histidine kinase HydH